MSRRTAALLLFALVAAWAWFAMRGRDGDAPVSAAVSIDSLPTATASPGVEPSAPDQNETAAPALDLITALADPNASTQAPPLPAPAALEPMPAWDANLVDVVSLLRARSDAGDMSAACHLGLALSACAMLMQMQPSAAELRLLDPADQDAVNQIAFRSQDFQRPGREKTCVGLRDADLDLRFDHLQRAADAGIRAAMIAYAEGIPLMSNDALAQRPEWLERYRQRAPHYVSELLRRGDRWMATLLYLNADGFRNSLLAQVLQMDLQTSATFWHLGRTVLSQPEQAFQYASADVNQAAHERARALFGRYFENRALIKNEFAPNRDFWRVEACTERG